MRPFCRPLPAIHCILLPATPLWFPSILTALCSYVAAASTITKSLFDGAPDLHGACALHQHFCDSCFWVDFKQAGDSSKLKQDMLQDSTTIDPAVGQANAM
jgi:hypothetical protein